MNQVLVNINALNALLAAAADNFRLIGLVNEVRSSVRALPSRIAEPAVVDYSDIIITDEDMWKHVAEKNYPTENASEALVVLETNSTDAGTVVRATRRIRTPPNPDTAE